MTHQRSLLGLLADPYVVRARWYETYDDLELLAPDDERSPTQLGDPSVAYACWSIHWSRQLNDESASTSILVHPSIVGVCPELAVDAPSDMLWVGFDRTVVGVSMATGRTSFAHDLGTRFAELSGVTKEGLRIVVYETGVVALDRFGTRRWELAGGLVTRHQRRGDVLTLWFDDSPPLELSVADGRKL